MTPHNKTRRLLGIATVLAATLLTALVIGTTRSAGTQRRTDGPEAGRSTPPSEPQGRADETDALRREVALLRREVSAGRRAGSEKEAESESTVGDDAERSRLIAESDRRVVAQAEANEAALRAEPVDAAWSGKARDLIARALTNDAMAATSVKDVDCRATLCRVRVTHANGRARAVFEHLFALGVGELMSQVMAQVVEDQDGSSTQILYLAREGHDFPSPAAPPVSRR